MLVPLVLVSTREPKAPAGSLQPLALLQLGAGQDSTEVGDPEGGDPVANQKGKAKLDALHNWIDRDAASEKSGAVGSFENIMYLAAYNGIDLPTNEDPYKEGRRLGRERGTDDGYAYGMAVERNPDYVSESNKLTALNTADREDPISSQNNMQKAGQKQQGSMAQGSKAGQKKSYKGSSSANAKKILAPKSKWAPEKGITAVSDITSGTNVAALKTEVGLGPKAQDSSLLQAQALQLQGAGLTVSSQEGLGILSRAGSPGRNGLPPVAQANAQVDGAVFDAVVSNDYQVGDGQDRMENPQCTGTIDPDTGECIEISPEESALRMPGTDPHPMEAGLY